MAALSLAAVALLAYGVLRERRQAIRIVERSAELERLYSEVARANTAKSEFLNKDPLKGTLGAPGQSQSNLWFIAPAQLDACGPALGRGAE